MRISNLQKKMGGFSLHIEHIHIHSSGIYGLIGPNGCGKTTAAKLIADILPYDAGEIDYHGLTSRDITMLPQKPYLMRDTVYNNLVYPLRLRGVKPDSGLCAEYLKRIGLNGHEKQQALSLSSGEQQKLALARAVIFKPKLMIVDEALTDLDIESLSMAEQWLMSLQKEHSATLLIISHQLSHVQRLCEYIFFMADGRIEAEGSANEILLNPQNRILQQYLKAETIEMEVRT